jgi:anti-sigma factor RsiW
MDKWTDKLSDYIDGELTQTEQEALEAHLLECAECGLTLQELRAIVTRAGQVIDREPQHDLWAGIAARIETAVPDQDMSLATSPIKRRVSFSIPQLAAASVALMLVSATAVYMMLQPGQTQFAEGPTVQVTQPTVAQTSARAVTLRYDDAVTELQGVLDRNRDQLDTATVRVLEQNLAIIDRAINEARNALGQEPANPYLTKYLDEAMQRKVQLLRRATSVMRAQT